MKNFKTLLLLFIGFILVSCNSDSSTETTEESKNMVHFFRNAAMKIDYAGQTFLLDPMLADKGTLQSFAGVAPNPTVDLPLPAEEIVKDLDAVLITHTHPDHYDMKAKELLDKALPLFCQPADGDSLITDGFTNVKVVEEYVTWKNITITKTGGKHGSGGILEMMGEVSGFILEADNEPTIYIIGDCIWDDEIKGKIEKHNPDIIITNSGGAIVPGFEDNPLLMDIEGTISVAKAAPKAKIIAVHMESLDHCTVSREDLRKRALEEGLESEKFIVPENGDKFNL